MTSACWKLIAYCIVGFMCYFGLVMPRIQLPALADEVHILCPGETEGATATHYSAWVHPPLFLSVLRASVRYAGWHGPDARWIGIASFAMTLILLIIIAEHCVAGAGAWALLLGVLHPLAIQGSLLIDIDTSMLATVVVAFAGVCLWSAWPLSRRRILCLLALWSLGAWMKFASMVWMGNILCVAWCLQRDRTQHLWQVLMIVGSGTGLFVSGWLAYSAQQAIDPWVAITHNALAVTSGFHVSPLAWGSEMGLRAARIILWLLPTSVLVMWWGVRWWRSLTDSILRWQMGALMLTSVSMLVAYWFVRGTTFAFPKYHYPAIPLLIIWWACASAACAQRMPRSTMRDVTLLALMSVGTWWMLGDPLMTLNSTLRDALVLGQGTQWVIIGQLLMQGVLWIGWVGVLWVLWRMWYPERSLATAMVASVLLFCGHAAAQDFMQYRAPHSTTFGYGRSYPDFHHARAAVEDLYQQHPDTQVMVPLDIAYAAGLLADDVPRVVDPEGWPDALLSRLEEHIDDPHFRMVIISHTYHSVAQMRAFAQPAVQRLLHAHFTQDKAGEYTIWTRKAPRIG
jgi:hypothetical protein